MKLEYYCPRTTTKRHKQWSRILRRLKRMLDEYNTPPGDAAYWYGERALTGLLAAAAWKLNGWSLEEFTSLRWKGQKEKTGKGDAWVGLGGIAFTIEAKVRWPQDTSLDSWQNNVDKGIAEASQQLKDLAPKYKTGTIKTAVCYVVPQILTSKFSKKKRELFTTFKKLPAAVCNAQTFAASYWYSRNPPKFKNPRNGKLYVYPGLVVVARFRKRI